MVVLILEVDLAVSPGIYNIKVTDKNDVEEKNGVDLCSASCSS